VFYYNIALVKDIVGGKINKILILIIIVVLIISGCTAKQYRLSGDLFVKSGEYYKAVEEYTKWSRREPQNFKPLTSLSVAYYMQENYKEAAKSLKKAFEIDSVLPKETVAFYEGLLGIENYTWNVFYNGAEVFLSENQNLLALKMIEEAEKVEDKEKKASSFALHGKLFIVKEEEKEALEYLFKAVEIDENNFEAYVYLGEVYSKLEKPTQAIKYLKKAITIDTETFTAYKLLGENYLKIKKYDSAIEMFEKASSIRNNDLVILYYLADAYLKKEDYARAINVAEKILDLPEENTASTAEIYILLGISNFHLEKYSEAIEALKKAIELDPDKCDSYQLLAHSYNKIGKDSLSEEFSDKWENCVSK
jgi:tetratricopeptide (TPR) repeat protein